MKQHSARYGEHYQKAIKIEAGLDVWLSLAAISHFVQRYAEDGQHEGDRNGICLTYRPRSVPQGIRLYVHQTPTLYVVRDADRIFIGGPPEANQPGPGRQEATP